MIAKRNSHPERAVYDKRDGNEHASDLTREWLKRTKMNQRKFKQLTVSSMTLFNNFRLFATAKICFRLSLKTHGMC